MIRLPLFSTLRIACVVTGTALLGSTAAAGALTIVNAGFETDTAPATGASGWTVSSGGTDWFIADGNQADSSNDPAAAFEGNNWLSGNRLVDGAGASSNPQTIQQLIDITAEASLIDTGSASVNLSFQFSESDQNDEATANIAFYSDAAGTSPIGSLLTSGILAQTADDGVADAPWDLRELNGAVPAGARSLSIELSIQRLSGSAGNAHFDDFSGSIVPEPATVTLIGLAVAGVAAAGRRRD